jgi:hypothetical protein
MTDPRAWLPTGFAAPAPVVVPYGHRLRPPVHADLARLVVAEPHLDRLRAERRLTGWLAEAAARTAYTYVLVDTDETAILGGVRIDPDGACWCVVEECRGTDLAAAFDTLVGGWVAAHWPGLAHRPRPRSGTHLR